MAEYSLPEYDADFITGEKAFADLFDACVSHGSDPKAVSNWIMSDVSRLLNERGLAPEAIPFIPERFSKLLALVDGGKISRTRRVPKSSPSCSSRTKDPEQIVSEQGMAQISDEGAIREMCAAVLAANERAVADYKAGKAKALTSLVGQVMKASKGKANPALVNKLLVEMMG